MAKKKSKSTSQPAPALDVATEDNTNLMDDLFAHLDSTHPKQTDGESTEAAPAKPDDAGPPTVNKKPDSKARFLARKAKKAASLANSLPETDPEAEKRRQQDIQSEHATITSLCEQMNLQLYPIPPDGHCLFSAIADQLSILEILPESQASHSTTRSAAAAYMLSHSDEFMPFLTSSSGDIMSQAEYQEYCISMRDTAKWGGEPEILALCRAYNTSIHVVQASIPSVVVHDPDPEDPLSSNLIARLSYHRHMYGLGEHYNSLRPK